MIKNQKQAESTRKKITELKQALSEFETETPNKDSAKYRLGKNSFTELIKDLENQIGTYDSLIGGDFHCLKVESLEDISSILISARLAQKKSQKDLGDLIGLKEQQIQRYESTDYETASWPRIVEIAMALKLKFYFEKIIILDGKSFDYPENITSEQAEEASKSVKQKGLTNLII